MKKAWDTWKARIGERGVCRAVDRSAGQGDKLQYADSPYIFLGKGFREGRASGEKTTGRSKKVHVLPRGEDSYAIVSTDPRNDSIPIGLNAPRRGHHCRLFGFLLGSKVE